MTDASFRVKKQGSGDFDDYGSSEHEVGDTWLKRKLALPDCRSNMTEWQGFSIDARSTGLTIAVRIGASGPIYSAGAQPVSTVFFKLHDESQALVGRVQLAPMPNQERLQRCMEQVRPCV